LAPNGLSCLLVYDNEEVEKEKDGNNKNAESSTDAVVPNESEEGAEEGMEEDDEDGEDDESSAEKCAASIAVNAGQMQDYAELPGLAHLTEHLLMMGSEEFPDENEYDDFLSTAGGHNNAWTDLENTVYYFDCQSSNFQGALRRFAACFRCPLLSKSSIGREISAVDSEHAKNVQNDSWRSHQLTRTVLGRSSATTTAAASDTAGTTAATTTHHPYGSFGTGNKESLGAHDLDELERGVRRFYRQYYTACNMTLCVVLGGRQDVANVERLITEYFSGIPAGTPEENVPKPLPPFAPALPKRIDTVPISDVTTIELQWPMRETQSLYESKPTRFLSHLLGHEGPGSLLAALRKKHWAQELMADDGSKSCRDFSIFHIEIELTKLGLQNLKSVVAMVYAYLRLLQDIPSWVYDELKATSDMQFRFLSKRPPSDTASSLAVQMQHYASNPDRFLSGPYKLFVSSHPAERIAECWKYMTPQNMLLVVSSKEVKDTDQTDPWYGTEFAEKVVDEGLLKEWTKCLTVDDDPEGLFVDLRLPDKNDMLATNFELIEPHPAFVASTDDKNKKKGPRVALPRCLVDTPTCRLWYKPDTVFSQPKVNVVMLLRTCFAYVTSPVDSVLASLWVEFLHEHCKEFSYAASMAGLHLDFHNTRVGMEVHVSGYSQKAEILLRRISESVLTLPDTLTNEIFERIVDKLKNQFSQFMVAQPYQHAMYAADLCLDDIKWRMHDRMACLDDIAPADLIHFSKTLLSRYEIEMLVHGNVSGKDAIGYSEIVLKAWHPRPPYQVPALRVARLESDAVYRFKVWNEDDNNNCVHNVYQIGPVDVRTNATLSVLQHLMREPAFNMLRTEETLGYIVHTSIKTSGTVIKGWLCLIQGDSFDPTHMDDRVEAFLVKMRGILVDLSKEKFETNVQSVVQNLREKNKNLGEESTKYWGVISNQTYRFRRLEEIAEEAEKLTKLDVIRFFDRYLHAKSPYRRKLSIQVFGKNHADILDKQNDSGSSPLVIDDPKAFCQSQPLYPVPPTVSIDEMKLDLA